MNQNDFNMDRYQVAPGAVSSSESAVSKSFLFNVYNWMAMGLAITGVIAYGLVAYFGESEIFVFFQTNTFALIFLIILQLGLVLLLSFALQKIPTIVAYGAFLLYSALTGVTMSTIFVLYTGTSIAATFFVCAGMFLSVSVFGYITKMNLSKFGTFLFMGLIGLVIASVVNIFLNSSTLEWIISYVGVLLFVGLTAYDTQKIKRMAMSLDANSEEGKKASIFGALMLYLDFINLFLFLLRIMGDRK